MDWKCVTRPVKDVKSPFAGIETTEHPLKTNAPLRNDTRAATVSRQDLPLTLDPLDGSLDPLSRFAQSVDFSPETQFKAAPAITVHYDQWSSRRNAILSRYTTSEKLSIITSFLAGEEIIKSTTTVSDKVKYRLEQLDNFDEDPVRQVMNLSQYEYQSKIEQLNEQLRKAWNSDQRVKALKIVIQCSKLLSDTSVMQFYPSKFVLVTEILDLFGKLVYERLKNKSEYFRTGSSVMEKLPDSFTPEQVPETTKETCFNWFYKIASIRELLPRFYVETAIVKSYQFIGSSELIVAALNRLTFIARGIGDPLVSAYARAYLCRVGMSIVSVSPEPSFLRSNFDDILAVYQTMFLGGIRSEITRQRLSMYSYMSLYSPAFEWILHGVVTGAENFALDELVLKCQEKKNCAPLFHAILMAFPREFVALRALHFVNILCKCDTETYSRSQMLRALGSCLSDVAPPPDQIRDVFEYVWRTVGTFTQVEEYLTCIETWMPFIAEHLSLRELNVVFEDLLNRCNASKNVYEQFYPELRNVVERTVTQSQQFFQILVLEAFLPVIDLFKKETVKVEVCKTILRRLVEWPTEIQLSDPVLINALMHVAKTLNDSVNTLSVDDERRQISDFVTFFVRLVNFGADFEQNLVFYVDARAAFTNLPESVYQNLVQLVNKLAIDTWKVVGGRHTRKTLAFLKSCIAFCFVTIPSISSVPTKLELYLLTGQIALMNGCLGQADASLEAALNIVPEIPRQLEWEGKTQTSDQYLAGYLRNFLTTLIAVPDSPDQGVLYLLRKLIEVVRKQGLETSFLIAVYLDILDTLFIMSQEQYPFHIPNVISNDELYGHDPKYVEEINGLCTQICSQILVNLKVLADNNELRQQAKFSLELFSRICQNADLSDEKSAKLATNLFNLAAKQKSQLEKRAFVSELQKLEGRIRECEDNMSRSSLLDIYEKAKLKLQ